MAIKAKEEPVKEKPKPVTDGLVELTDGISTVRAHPTQVALWQAQGWQIVEA